MRIALLVLLFLIPSVSALEVELLSTNPAPIEAGDYADITILFSKDATESSQQDILFKIERTPFITPISDGQVEINGLRFNDDVTRTFRVFFSEDLPEGFIDIQTELEIDGVVLQRDLPVFIQEERSNPELFIGSVETTPNELLPDTDDNELLVTVQNLGDKDAELVRAELVIEDPNINPAYAYSLVDSVSSIDAGTEAEMFFVIDLEEDAREPIAAELQVRYRAETNSGTSYETFEAYLPLVIPVQDAPFLEVVGFEQLDSFETKTTENRIRVAILNSGTEDAEEVRVRVLPDISYPFIFELTTEYVASKIEPGETAYVEFTMEILDAQIREYPITLRLESLVGESRYAREDTMIVSPSEGRQIGTNNLGYILVGVALFAAIVLGYKMKKKK